MIDIKFIRENPEKVKENCENRGCGVDIDRLLRLDERKRKILQTIEQKRAEHNKLNKEYMHNGEKRLSHIRQAEGLKELIKTAEQELTQVEEDYKKLALQLPNMLLEDVPVGKDEKDNKLVKKVGNPPKFSFRIKDHSELGEDLDLIDAERAGKVAGSRFAYLKNQAVLLEFALLNLAMEALFKKGFAPILPPVMLKSEMAKGMGYLEQADTQEAYYLAKDDLYLVGTSEQSLGTMHAGEVFPEDELPKRYAGFSTCFRREAGSYGKDTKGIVRLHQFDKVEMFVFCRPEDSSKEHRMLIAAEEELLKKLELPYQLLHLCSADMGRPSASTFDIETWIPSQNKYRETHSCSNCTDFQARRLDIKYKSKKTGKSELVHMLNGTAFAMPRLLAAILENCQQKDGSVKVPKVLQKYTKFSKILPA